MTHHILIVNCGSSSVKMAVVALPQASVVAHALAERLHDTASHLHWTIDGKRCHEESVPKMNHATAISRLLQLWQTLSDYSIDAVGHRVVHGGEKFIHPTLIDRQTFTELEKLSPLAPLHNPMNLLGIELAMNSLPQLPHVAVFDTAFHHSIPASAFLYAVPYSWYQQYGIRRYGFHGSSHASMAEAACRVLGKKVEDCHLLTTHLGNGCSASAIAYGRCVDTTMGLTPLEGMMMGTRSGDIDPGLHEYLARQSGLSLSDISRELNQKSGLLGVSGISQDMRTLQQKAAEGHARARLAIDMYCYRIAKSIAAMTVALPMIDAWVFSGGVGEHAAEIRQRIASALNILNIELDVVRNQQNGTHSNGFISSDGSKTAVLIVPCREDIYIASETCKKITE